MRKFSFFLVLILALAFAVGPAVAREDTVIPVSGKQVGGKPYVELIDEDEMSSNSPYAVPTQQSVKAYVDSEVERTKDLTFTAGTGFSITAADLKRYRVFRVDRSLDTASSSCPIMNADTGCTVNVATPTGTDCEKPFTLVCIDSGTTPLAVYMAGLPVINASGVTDAMALDAQGDSGTFLPDYNSAVSLWGLNKTNN